MSETPTDPRVVAVIAASDKEAGRRSPLFKWMMNNHALLAAEFAANGPQWVIRTRAMVAAGLVDADGKAPTQRTAMQTWYRVCRAIGASPKRQAVRPAEPAATTLTTKPAPEVGDDEVTLRGLSGKTIATVRIPK